MEDFEDTYKNAVDAGQRNLKATKLLSNWCLHAEFVRSGGRGLIEAETSLPIGHMGVQCKFSKKKLDVLLAVEGCGLQFLPKQLQGLLREGSRQHSEHNGVYHPKGRSRTKAKESTRI